MLRLILAAMMSFGLSAAAPAWAGESIPKPIAKAVADPGRPASDTERDVNRKPAEVLAFTGVKRGDKVAELLPGGGYFTRLLGKIAGPKGHVYVMVSTEILKIRPSSGDAVKALAADKAYGNITVTEAPAASFAVPEPVDLVWTSNNYHDFKLPLLGPVDTAALNRKIFEALKPGGIYLVLDHAAAPGSGVRDCETLHRIDPEAVVAEVTAAGFVLDSRSDLLRNTEDDHTTKATHGPIRGKTDQFILKFRKPTAP